MKTFNLQHFILITDQMNSQNFAKQFAPDARWFFANYPAITGRENIMLMANRFYSSLVKIEHNISDYCLKGSKTFFEGKVSYTLKDQKYITLPFACTLVHTSGLIREYRSYIDQAPLQELLVANFQGSHPTL